MNDLINYFEGSDAENIENALCEAEEVAINQENDDPADIVGSFAELIPGLTGSRTQGNTFAIHYHGRTKEVALEHSPADEDAVRRSIRDVLTPDYEVRVLRSCLGTDTLAFVVDTPVVWHQVDTQFPEIARELFTPFADEIGFGSAP